MFYLQHDIDLILQNSKELIKFFSGKTILITGGRGFLGRYFAVVFHKFNNLLDKPIKVIIIDNLITGEKIFDKENYSSIKFIERNACEPYKNFEKVDIIIHAAGIASPFYYKKYPIETLDVAVNGTRNVLDLAKIYEAKVIFFSSSEIYGDPDSKAIPIKESYRGNVSSIGPRACYDESKRIGETLCYIYNNYFGVHTNIIRPFNIYGPGMLQKDYRILPNFINNILNNKEIKSYGSGNQTRTYCYITDAIEGFLGVISMGKPGETYNIGNDKPEISVKDLFKLLENIHDKKIFAKKVNYPESYPEDEPQRRCPDISKANKDLNYEPKISLDKGVKNYLSWAKNNYVK